MYICYFLYTKPVAEQFQNLYNGSMLESSENVTITELYAGFFNNQTQKRGGCK